MRYQPAMQSLHPASACCRKRTPWSKDAASFSLCPATKDEDDSPRVRLASPRWCARLPMNPSALLSTLICEKKYCRKRQVYHAQALNCLNKLNTAKPCQISPNSIEIEQKYVALFEHLRMAMRRAARVARSLCLPGSGYPPPSYLPTLLHEQPLAYPAESSSDHCIVDSDSPYKSVPLTCFPLQATFMLRSLSLAEPWTCPSQKNECRQFSRGFAATAGSSGGDQDGEPPKEVHMSLQEALTKLVSTKLYDLTCTEKVSRAHSCLVMGSVSKHLMHLHDKDRQGTLCA